MSRAERLAAIAADNLRLTRAELDREVAARAGCLILRRSRSSGTLVGLYRTAEAGLDDSDDGTFATVCEDHGSILCHPTRAVAESYLSHSADWCEDCRANLDAIDELTQPSKGG